jgi:protein gp37
MSLEQSAARRTGWGHFKVPKWGQMRVPFPSGPKHRTVRIEWLRQLRDQCIDEDVAYFFKQWGGHRPKAGGRLLDGRTWDEMPRTRVAEPV